MDFRDFITAHFSCKLDPKVYHTYEDKVEFHFHPHLETPWTRSKRWQEAAAMLQRSGLSDIRKLKKDYQVCMAFFFCFFFSLLIISFVVFNSGMYNNTHEPVLCLTCIEAWWPTWLLKIRQHFHWYPMCPLNLTKKSFTCMIAGKDPRSVQKRRHIEIISLMTN